MGGLSLFVISFDLLFSERLCESAGREERAILEWEKDACGKPSSIEWTRP